MRQLLQIPISMQDILLLSLYEIQKSCSLQGNYFRIAKVLKIYDICTYIIYLYESVQIIFANALR